MARKIVLHSTGHAPNRQQIWEVIRALHADGQQISVRDVRASMTNPMPRTRVEDYVRGLEAAGYLERLNPERKPGQCVLYAIVRDIGVEAPRVRRDGSEPSGGRGREQMWRTMRILGEFTAAELADAASTPDTRIAINTAHEYCYFLRDAEYLQVTRQSSPGIPERYRLNPRQWTGPLAPMIQRAKQLFDPNTGEVVFSRVTQTVGGEP